jgi:hypothetical protein
VLIWFLVANCKERNDYWAVFFAIVLNGTINIGIYSSCFEYAVAITPDYGESLSAGLINCLANTLGFAWIILFQAIVGVKDDTKNELNVMMYILIGGCILSFIL